MSRWTSRCTIPVCFPNFATGPRLTFKRPYDITGTTITPSGGWLPVPPRRMAVTVPSTQAPPQNGSSTKVDSPVKVDFPVKIDPPVKTDSPVETGLPAKVDPLTKLEPPAKLEPSVKLEPPTKTEPPAETGPPVEEQSGCCKCVIM